MVFVEIESVLHIDGWLGSRCRPCSGMPRCRDWVCFWMAVVVAEWYGHLFQTGLVPCIYLCHLVNIMGHDMVFIRSEVWLKGNDTWVICPISRRIRKILRLLAMSLRFFYPIIYCQIFGWIWANIEYFLAVIITLDIHPSLKDNITTICFRAALKIFPYKTNRTCFKIILRCCYK